ncbi:MAG: hypothetical protein NTV09_00235 [Bacteroidetes bacterium]|nr:hypothetical protein [Bacteroidota bacterium]
MENLTNNNYFFIYGAARKCARCNKIQVSYGKMDEADMYFI